MTYKTHMIGGIALAGVIHLTAIQMTEIEMIGYYGFALLGTMLPDIDHPKSFISRYSLGLHYLFKGCKHRGFTHTLLAAIILVMLLGGFFGMNAAVFGIGIGYVSHLLLDALNPRGVPILYPFTKAKYHVANIRTGGEGEYVIFGMLVVVALYCIYNILT